MIQIEAIHIEEFRGIRNLGLTLGCKPFVVWGPNGSGKSGVVDAIDFALTGSIARLTGAGTGGLTVLKHGPHVIQRDNAAAAKVSLTVCDTASGQQAVLTRSIKTASTYTLEPDTPAMRTAVERARQHPELTLSRREIIKFVVAEAGKRAQEVQILLKLDRIDETRRLLKTAQTKCSSANNAGQSEVTAAEEAMRRHLDLTDLLAAEVTHEINLRRETLGLEKFDAVNIETDLLAGVAHGEGAPFNKASAVNDIRTLSDRLSDNVRMEGEVGILSDALVELDGDPGALAALRQRGLVEAGIELVDDALCPLCDLEWQSVEALRTHLKEKLNRSTVADQLRERIQAAANALRADIRATRGLISAVVPHARAFGDDELPHRLQTWAEDLTTFEASFPSIDGVIANRHRLTTDPSALPLSMVTDLATLIATVEALPDQSATVDARTYLTVAKERWTRVRLARAAYAKANAAYLTSNAVYATYCSVADESLTTLYKTIEAEFSEYYRHINADDESSFKADLEPSAGKLELAVDFYGVGMFPPAAYHSEGHQDGMGVCLYLALVKRLLGDDFRFAVLDDVVMSVDKTHRRQFCTLLKDTFPDVQFIITTHDEVWVRQMQASGLIGKSSQARFHGWTVEDGPHYEQGDDVWDRIDADLVMDDVPGAAHKLRRHLESTLADLAAVLRGQVPYKPENNYELSDFLSATTGRHGEWLKKAAASANSWNNEAVKLQVEALKKARNEALLTQRSETWAINPLVHYNEWATMDKADFVPVVDAWKQYFALFSCANGDCGSWIYVVGQPGHEESLRCSCGTFNLNLLTK
jgi:hypothetical protein